MGGLLAGWMNVGVSIVFPLGFFMYLLLFRRGQLPAFVVGMTTFAVAEILVCVPLFQWLATLPAMQTRPVVYTLLLALCAALLEGLARWVAFKFLLRRHHTLPDGVALGVGHAGLGTFIASLGYLITAIFFPALLQSEGFSTIAVSSVEGLLTLAIGVSVTLLILRGVQKGQPAFLALGIGAHLLFRAVAVLRYAGLGDWGQQGVLFVLTAATVAFVVKTRSVFGDEGLVQTQRKKAVKAAEPGSLDENIWK